MRKFASERFPALLARLLAIFGCLSNPVAICLAEDETGHHLIQSSFPPFQTASQTVIPGSNFVLRTLRHTKGLHHPVRDEGEGRLAWQSFDPNGICERVALSADGRWMAAGYFLNDERLEVRNALTGDTLFTFPVEYGAGWVAMSADGSLIAYGAMDSVWLFRRQVGAIPVFRFGLNGFGPGPLALSRDGEILIVTANDPERAANRAWAFQVGNDEPLWSLEVDGDESFVWMGARLADLAGRLILTSKFQIYAVETASGEIIWQTDTYNTESPAVVSDDGEILTTGSLYGRLRTFRWEDDGEAYIEMWHYGFTAELGAWITTTAISPDGGFIAAGTLDFFDDNEAPFKGRLALFDAYGDGSPLWVAEPLADEISAIAFSRDGGVVAAVSWGDVNNDTPNLVVHERHNSEPFYTLNTEGSLSGLAISDDGSVIVAGGKSVHNRVFGRGGRLFGVRAEYPGGMITGTVRDEDGNAIAGAEITASGNPYVGISDQSGNYRLRIEIINAGRFRLTARQKGYLNDTVEDIPVRRGEITEEIDFNLNAADEAPRNLRASIDRRNAVVLTWEQYNRQRRPAEFGLPLRNALTGDVARTFASLSPWDMERTPPHRDQPTDAERIIIYRSPHPTGVMQPIGSVDGDVTRFVDRRRVFPMRSYYYAVTAEFENGESHFSNRVRGAVDGEFLDWEAELAPMPNPPDIDGSIGEQEWNGAVIRDISDVYGYDEPDTAGSVSVKIGFSDATDRFYLAFDYHNFPRITNRMGVGVYIDDDHNGRWNYDSPASEGNYWGYHIDGAPVMFYRSLTGPPFAGPPAWPYHQFPNGMVAFGDERGWVQMEMAIPIGFHSPEEIAVYQPDRTIGLALFAMHRDENENPIFDGWWPQDVVSIVSNPYQFASVQIPVNLTVPPKAPGDLALERDGSGFRLSWRDPAIGLDNGRMRDLAGIEIARNGDSLTTVRPGVGIYRDSRTVLGGWYEYRLRGFVIENNDPFYGPWSVTEGLYAGRDPEVEVISLDDGSAESYFVVNFQGEDNRFAARFDLDLFRDTVAVYWIEFFTRTPDPVNVYIAADEGFTPGLPLGGVYRAESLRAEDWSRFHFPGLSQPRLVINPFGFNGCWAVLQYLPESPGAPGIGIDDSQVSGENNRYYTAENGEWRAFEYGQLMLRIAVGRPVATAPSMPELMPANFTVQPNFPNPFNSTTYLPVRLPTPSPLRILVFDEQGRNIDGWHYPLFGRGEHLIPVTLYNSPSGVYIIQVGSVVGQKIVSVVLIK